MRAISKPIALFLVMCSATIALASSHWQAEVPFDFTIKETLFPSGRYDIAVDSTYSFVTLTSYADPAKRVTWVAVPDKPINKPAVMIFKKIDTRYSLKNIQVGERSTPDLVTHREREAGGSVLAVDGR